MEHNREAYIKAASSVEKFLDRSFTKVEFSGPLFSPELINGSPVMIVCSHRSHLDYIILGSVLHHAGVTNIRFAAGDNLTTMPILGKRLTSFGAFSVHRAKRMKKGYVLDLCEKVVQMVRDGDRVIVFPEGGRSYSGAMVELQNGVIGAHVMAQHRYPEMKCMYLPITIVYEKFPELRYFSLVNKGRGMRSSSSPYVRRLIGNALYYGLDIYAFLKFYVTSKFGRNWGTVHIDYGEPIAVKEIVDIKKFHNPSSRNELTSHKEAIQAIGAHIYKKLFNLYRILPMHILAYILTTMPVSRRDQIREKIPEIVELLEKNGRNCRSIAGLAPETILEQGITQLEKNGAVFVKRHEIKVRNEQVISYFAATIDQK